MIRAVILVMADVSRLTLRGVLVVFEHGVGSHGRGSEGCLYEAVGGVVELGLVSLTGVSIPMLISW